MRRLTISVRACTEMMGLLVAMAWADGELDDEEKEGIRAAATTLNLNKELRDRLESFMKEAPGLGDLDLDALSARDREFAYVASAWMARVCKGVDDEEKALLEKIGLVLDIGSARRESLSQLAFDLRPPAPGQSWAKRIVKLFKTIPNEAEPAEEVEVDFE